MTRQIDDFGGSSDLEVSLTLGFLLASFLLLEAFFDCFGRLVGRLWMASNSGETASSRVIHRPIVESKLVRCSFTQGLIENRSKIFLSEVAFLASLLLQRRLRYWLTCSRYELA